MSGILRKLLLGGLAAAALMVTADFASAQRRRDYWDNYDSYWGSHWRWYDRDYRPYYSRRYYGSYYSPYYGYYRPYGYGYGYGYGYRPWSYYGDSGFGLRIGPFSFQSWD